LFKFLHAADLHLDSPLKGLERYDGAPVDEIRGATRRALQNLVAVAIEQQVQFVLIAGDVYDGDWKDHNTGLFFVSQMSRLRAADIPVVVISGNHDAANKMTKSLPLPDNVEWLSHTKAVSSKSKILADLGVAVHGRSFAKAAEMENLARLYPERKKELFNIGLLHTSLNGAAGHEPYAPCEVAELQQKEYDYWALGHVHTRQVKLEHPWIVYPGNIQGRQIRETGAKGCYLVTVDDHGTTSLEFQPLDVFRWEVCRVDVAGLTTGDDLLEQVSSGLSRLLTAHPDLPLAVRIQIVGESTLHDRLLAEPVNWTNDLRAAALDDSNGRIWLEKVEFRTTPPQSSDRAARDDGPIGELLQFFHELQEDDTALQELNSELDDLRRKLPEELLTGDQGLAFSSPEQRRALIEEIRPFLLNRLLKGNDR